MAGLINLRLLTDFFNKIDPSETWARPPSAQPELVHCPLLMCQF